MPMSLGGLILGEGRGREGRGAYFQMEIRISQILRFLFGWDIVFLGA